MDKKTALETLKGAIATAKQDMNSGNMQALQDAEALYNKAVQDEEKKTAGEVGDGIREELSHARKSDARYAPVNHGSGVGPAQRSVLASYSRELAVTMPEGTEADPFAQLMLIPSNKEEIKELQRRNDLLAFMAGFMPTTMRQPAVRAGLDDLRQRTVDILAPANASAGADWMPTWFSPELVADVYLDTVVLNAMPRMVMAAPTVQIGQLTAEPLVQRTSGATTDASISAALTTVSSLTTDNALLVADRLNTIVGRSDEMSEDSFISLAPMLMERMVRALGSNLEDSVINGCHDTSHLDNAAVAKLWTATSDPRYCWDGLRRDAEITSAKVDAGGTGAFTIADVVNLKTKIGKYGSGSQRERCVFWGGVDAEAMLLKLTELVTVDKYGDQATVLRGEIGKLFGIPVLISGNVYGPYQGTGLNASGVYDNVTTTATVMGITYLDAYVVGDRRSIRIEEQRMAIGGATYTIASWRGAFGKTFPDAKLTSAVLYNVIP